MRVPLLNFEGGPGVPLLNFRGVPGPILNFEGRLGCWGPGPIFTPCHWAPLIFQNMKLFRLLFGRKVLNRG